MILGVAGSLARSGCPSRVQDAYRLSGYVHGVPTLFGCPAEAAGARTMVETQDGNVHGKEGKNRVSSDV